MKRMLSALIGVFAVLMISAAPASAGVGGVKYFAVQGAVDGSGQVSWKFTNYWNTVAYTSSRLGAIKVPLLSNLTVIDSTPLQVGQCASIAVTGHWQDGSLLRGYLSTYVCR